MVQMSYAMLSIHVRTISDALQPLFLSRIIKGQQKEVETMGISRDSRHKRRSTGGRKANIKKKRQYESGRPAAMTKLGQTKIHEVRVRGGNKKFRAMKLDHGSFR